MKALANGVDGGNGVYHYGPSGFPDTTFNATNYWVDASFDRTVPPDTRGPDGHRAPRRSPMRSTSTAGRRSPLPSTSRCSRRP